MLTNKLAIGTLSLGQHRTHGLDKKIIVAAQHGFSGIEIVFSDLEAYSESNNISMLEAAGTIYKLCEHHAIEIISLAPFLNFEGSNSPLQERLQTAQLWIDLARVLKAPYLQVPAQYSKDCTGDESIIVSELQQLSEMGSTSQPVVAIAYEPMSWSTHYSTWESALDLINKVDRANFGLCLDSFHIITKLWADSQAPTGKFPNADGGLRNSLTRFKEQCPVEKLFYVQLSGGERLDPPLTKHHPWYTEGEAPEFTWSKQARPFPLEADLGDYMPVGQFLKACVAEKKFSGWVSLEIFDRRMEVETFNPEDAAIRGQESWRKLSEEQDL